MSPVVRLLVACSFPAGRLLFALRADPSANAVASNACLSVPRRASPPAKERKLRQRLIKGEMGLGGNERRERMGERVSSLERKLVGE